MKMYCKIIYCEKKDAPRTSPEVLKILVSGDKELKPYKESLCLAGFLQKPFKIIALRSLLKTVEKENNVFYKKNTAFR